MPYPRAILTMAQNLVTTTAEDPNVNEKKFQMLWNGILNFHFPSSLGYGVVPQPSTTGIMPGFLLFNVAHDEENAALVVGLKEPAEDTPEGRENIVKELTTYLEIRFEGTKFSTMYAVCGIGMSFSVYKMDQNFDMLEPELVFDWASNVTAAASFDRMGDLASMIDDMTDTQRDV